MLKFLAFGIRHSALTSVMSCALLTATSGAQPPAARLLVWEDFSPAVRARLESSGITAASLPRFLEGLEEAHARRVREGDLDHLVFYALQSRHFTTLPPIEPALSAMAFTTTSQVPPEVRARLSTLLRAVDSPDRDPRLTYFRALVKTAFPDLRGREAALEREYARAMRFLYRKEFVAQRSVDPADA